MTDEQREYWKLQAQGKTAEASIIQNEAGWTKGPGMPDPTVKPVAQKKKRR